MKLLKLVRDRRYAAMLKRVRERWKASTRPLAAIDCLDEAQRGRLAGILLKHEIQMTAVRFNPWWLAGDLVAWLLSATMFVLVPLVAIFSMRRSYGVHAWSAYASFYVIYVVVLTLIWVASIYVRNRLLARRRPPGIPVIVLGYGGLVLLLLVVDQPPGREVAVAAVAAAALAPVALISYRTMLWFLDLTLWRMASRATLAISPVQALAAWMTQLLTVVAQQRTSWRRLSSVREVSLWTSELADALERDPDRLLNGGRLSRTGRAEIALRSRHAAQAIREYESRVLCLARTEDYEALVKDIALAAVQVADGTWPTSTNDVAQRQRRMLAMARRVIPAVTLAAAALALPALPGVSVAETTMTGLQVGLVLSAVLTLIPAESHHIEKVLSAYKDASR